MFDYKQQKNKPRIDEEEEEDSDDKMYVNHFSLEQLSSVRGGKCAWDKQSWKSGGVDGKKQWFVIVWTNVAEW